MNRAKWQILLGMALLALSAAVYFLHYLLFRDVHHIFIYLVGDVAFVFIEVLLVTLVIHGVLEGREKKERLTKLNMVIGVFFSEVGAKLLDLLTQCDPEVESLRACMVREVQTPGGALERIRRCLETHRYTIDQDEVDWACIQELLVNKRGFLVRLLENPSLLEHESFTDLLWAVFHLTEELDARDEFGGLPGSDLQHLSVDAKRVYGQLALEWVAHMEHLRANYPYLFSLALRMNPFEASKSVVVSEV